MGVWLVGCLLVVFVVIVLVSLLACLLTFESSDHFTG